MFYNFTLIKIILNIFLSTFFYFNSFSQETYRLLSQRKNKIFIYNYSNDSFKELLTFKHPYQARIKQIEDTLFIFEDSDEYLHFLDLSTYNSKLITLQKANNSIFLPIIKNNIVLRKDSALHFFNKSDRPRKSFSRIINNNLIWSEGGDIYLYYNNDTIKYLKHYVNWSFMAEYLNWGYVYPEISKDGNKLYFIDTYKFKYEGKHKLFNRKKDENYYERKYCYLIIMNFKTKEIIKTVKIPFIQTGSIYTRDYRNLQLSPDDKYLFFEAYPDSYLYDTETGKIIKLPKGYYYLTWLK